MRLDGDDEMIAGLVAPRVPEVTGITERGSEAPESDRPSQRPAGDEPLSVDLMQLLRDADRRIFPDRDPLEFRFPARDVPADELVPEELLQDVASPIDAYDADPLEQFTFVGAEPTGDSLEHGDSATTNHSLASTVNRGRIETQGTVADGPERRSLAATLAPTQSGGRPAARPRLTREGLLPPGGAIRLLWELVEEERPVFLTLEVPGQSALGLGIRGDALVVFEGAASRAAHARLRSLGELLEEPSDEAEAQVLLERAVRAERLDPFLRDRAVREAREAALAEVLVAPEASFRLTGSATLPEGPNLFAGSLLGVALEGIRRRVELGAALRWLGIDRLQVLRLGSSFPAVAAACGLEPEMVAAVERAADGPVAAFLEGAPAGAGAAGVLTVLAMVEACRFDDAPAPGEHALAHSALAARLRRGATLAREGDYFEILGVAPDASTREIQSRHRREQVELVALDLASLGLEDLEGARMEFLAALDEALDVLRDPVLRARYASALDLRGVAVPDREH